MSIRECESFLGTERVEVVRRVEKGQQVRKSSKTQRVAFQVVE